MINLMSTKFIKNFSINKPVQDNFKFENLIKNTENETESFSFFRW